MIEVWDMDGTIAEDIPIKRESKINEAKAGKRIF